MNVLIYLRKFVNFHKQYIVQILNLANPNIHKYQMTTETGPAK